MNPERWQRIKEVAFAAMELKEGQRSQFLDQECGSDSELRRAAQALELDPFGVKVIQKR